PRPAHERTNAVRTVAFLLENGAGTLINTAGQFGWMPLHGASYQGLNDVVELLVEHGAELDAFDEFGQTPLSIALAVLTEGIGARYAQNPKFLYQDTADLLLELGATPLAQSGVKIRACMTTACLASASDLGGR